MRLSWLALAFALGLVPSAGQPAQAAISSHYASLGAQRIAPGVVHDWGTVVADAGRQVVNVAEVDPFQPGINLRTSLAHDRVTARQRTTDQALAFSREARRVVATINGATFASWPMGHVAARGLNVRDGEVLTVGRVTNGPILGFGVDKDGRTRIGAPSFDIEVTLPDGAVGRVDRINQGRLSDEAVLFTPRFGSHTWTDTNGDEYVIEGLDLPLRPTGTYTGRVAQVRRGMGDTSIGAGQVVLSATGAAAVPFASLAVGDQVSLRLGIESGWDEIVHAVGGRELLVQDGKINIVPTRSASVNKANPRSAVGITREGKVLLVTVDGRSSDSGGLTFEELAELMIERGAVQALNLDGGGSTTLALRRPGDIEASIVNTPSDGKERTVATTLQVVSTFPTGELDRLLLSPRSTTLSVGQTQQYTVKGHDANYNGIAIDTAKVDWNVTDDAATVDSKAVLTALAAGDHTLTARLSGLEDSAALTILADASPPQVSAPLVTLRGGVGMSHKAARLTVSWTASDDLGSISGVELQRSVDGGTWQSVTLSSSTATQAYSKAGLGRTVQFRVRATDSAGNLSTWALSRTMRVQLYSEFDPAVTYTGTWTPVSLSDALGGQLARTTTLGATANLSFSGVQVAWVGQRGPKQGRADVYVNGTYVARVGLYNSSRLARRVLFVSTPADVSAPLPSTTIAVSHAGTSRRPRVDLDAFLVLLVVD